MYWFPRDNLIGKPPVKLSYPQFLGVKWVSTSLHLYVFVGYWSRKKYSRGSLFLLGYSPVDCNFSTLGQDVIFLWRWDPAYVCKL